MTDLRLQSKGNVRFKWYEPGSFANPYWPTVAELNSGQDLEGITLWDSFEVGAQASETSDAAPIKAKSAVARRAAAQYGGNASFWYAGYAIDMANLASLVYAIFREVHRPGFLAVSIDGDIGEAGQPADDYLFAHGDYLSLYGVVTDEWSDSIVGEEDFYYTRNFLKNGFMRTYTVASTSAPVLTVSEIGAASAVGDVGGIVALVNGRDWTRGCQYISSDVETVLATPSGAYRLEASGSADITVSLPRATPAVTETVAITVA